MKTVRPPTTVRDPALDLESLPRLWFGGSVIATQLGNALNLLFPMGERFLIRAVKPYVSELAARRPELAREVRLFIGQEARHTAGHERMVNIIAGHGVRVDALLRGFRWLAFEVLEPRVDDRTRLATAVAFEHLFASIGDALLRSGVLERAAAPGIRELLLWHAAEEIEHKATLFDVLADVDGSYARRIGGMAAAAPIWIGFVTVLTLGLLVRDPDAAPRRLLCDLRRGVTLGALRAGDLARAVLTYRRRDFHPDQHDNYGLAAAGISASGARPVTAAASGR